MKVYVESMLNKKVILKYGENNSKEYSIKEELEDHQLESHGVKIKINSCALPYSQHSLLQKLDVSKDVVPVGRDISGVVVAVGKDVTMIKLEDEVVGIIPATSLYSGCAFYCIVSEFDVVPKPDMVSHVDACCGIGDSVKAYTALFYQAKITSGETVLIADACTGFGIIANQLAQYWGAKVIVTGSTDEEITFLKNLSPPANQVVDLRNKRRTLAAVCLEETGGLGVDCFLDNKVEMYSDEYLDTIQMKKGGKILPTKHDVISSLAVGGRWITQQCDLQIDPPDSELLTLKCASVHYLFEFAWTLSRASQGRYMHILNDVMTKMAAGVLRPTVHHTVLFDDCISCLQNTDQTTSNIGKIIVKI